jgi:hypothetical protein
VARHRVIDLRRVMPLAFRDPAAPPSQELEARDASWLCMLVENLTACAIGPRWQRGITRCEDSRCAGVVALRRTGDACEWYCNQCAASGAVVGFRDSQYDLTQRAERDVGIRSDALVYTRVDELDAARRQNLPVALRYVLAIAIHHAQGHVTVAATEEELAGLCASLESALPRAHDDDLLPLHRLLARLDAAILSLRAHDKQPVTLH